MKAHGSGRHDPHFSQAVRILALSPLDRNWNDYRVCYNAILNLMTAEERRIAIAALGAGSWDTHDQIVIAVADGLKLEAKHVEAVLQRLRIRMVLFCVSAARAGSGSAESVRYERGMDWTEEE